MTMTMVDAEDAEDGIDALELGGMGEVVSILTVRSPWCGTAMN